MMIKEDKLIKGNKPKVLHFPDDFSIEEIEKLLINKKDIIYFTRLINNEFHIVKHKKHGKFQLLSFFLSLCKHYEQNKVNLKNVDEIKGNDNFVIIKNLSPKLIDIIKTDLNKLLIN